MKGDIEMEFFTNFFNALYDAIAKIFDSNVDENGEKRDIFERIKAALDTIFGIA